MYKLKSLSYEYDSLEPFIDTHTLGLHHKRHQQNYLNKLNELLVKNNYKFNYSIEELSKHIMEFNIDDREDILFNLGGVVNHDIYFSSMLPVAVEPSVYLKTAMLNTFGSIDNFKKKFKESALSIKGSGYTFLVLDKNSLKIINLKNQDNPYYYNLVPLLGLDMWEHAYYINYENKKDLYIDNFLNQLNFSEANKIFELQG